MQKLAGHSIHTFRPHQSKIWPRFSRSYFRTNFRPVENVPCVNKAWDTNNEKQEYKGGFLIKHNLVYLLHGVSVRVSVQKQSYVPQGYLPQVLFIFQTTYTHSIFCRLNIYNRNCWSGCCNIVSLHKFSSSNLPPIHNGRHSQQLQLKQEIDIRWKSFLWIYKFLILCSSVL